MEMMGHSPAPKTKPKKRLALALEKAAASAKAPLAKKSAAEDPARKPWFKLRKTAAQNPKRAYLQGTHDRLEKL